MMIRTEKTGIASNDIMKYFTLYYSFYSYTLPAHVHPVKLNNVEIADTMKNKPIMKKAAWAMKTP